MHQDLSLQDIIMVFLKRWWLFVMGALLGGIIAFSYNAFMVTPVYDSVGTLIVNNSRTNTSGTINQSDILTSQQLVATYSVVLKSERFLSIVAEEANLGYDTTQIASMLSINSVNNTEVMKVRVRNIIPEHATIVAQSVLDNAKDEIIRVVEAGSVRIIDNASIPTAPSGPNIPAGTLLGILFGLLITAVFIIGQAMFDTTVKHEQDLSKRFEKPILGSIPVLGEPSNKK